MRQFAKYSAAFALCFAVTAGSQELPRLSPKAEVMQTVGLTEVTIAYCSPAVRGRVIWGDLVPYDKVWRTGANEATTISFSDDVRINGFELKAGRYALFTIPRKNEWSVIFNLEANQWGAFDKDDSKDTLEVMARPEYARDSRERLSFTFDNVTEGSADVVLQWERIRLSFTISTDVQATAIRNIRAALAELKEDDWATLNRCATYCIQNDILMDEAVEWLNRSIAIKQTFWNLREKAQLEARNGKIKEAIAFGEMAISAGDSDDQPPPLEIMALWKEQVDEWRRSM